MYYAFCILHHKNPRKSMAFWNNVYEYVSTKYLWYPYRYTVCGVSHNAESIPAKWVKNVQQFFSSSLSSLDCLKRQELSAKLEQRINGEPHVIGLDTYWEFK